MATPTRATRLLMRESRLHHYATVNQIILLNSVRRFAFGCASVAIFFFKARDLSANLPHLIMGEEDAAALVVDNGSGMSGAFAARKLHSSLMCNN